MEGGRLWIVDCGLWMEGKGLREKSLWDVRDHCAFALGEVHAFLESSLLQGFFDEAGDLADLGCADDEINVRGAFADLL